SSLRSSSLLAAVTGGRRFAGLAADQTDGGWAGGGGGGPRALPTHGGAKSSSPGSPSECVEWLDWCLRALIGWRGNAQLVLFALVGWVGRKCKVPFAIHNLPRSLLVSSTRRIEKSSEKDLPPRGTGDLLMSLCTSARILSISKFVMHDCK
uniref:Uncharacterized protein n=1 Tax=Aegilops tauschii subsp. strangulata TaxID=200361 RepID=A0A453R4W0_AEGTS